MPATFTNIQVFGANTRPERLARLVSDALKSRVRQEGFEPIPREEAADREVAVVIPPRGGWVTVLDQASDGKRLHNEALARQLSHDLGGPTLSLAQDPAGLSLGLHVDGATLGTLPQDASGTFDPEGWRMVLAPGVPPSELVRACAQPEGALARLGRLLGLDSAVTDVGYRDLGRLGLSGARLRFKALSGARTSSGPRLRAGLLPGQKLQPQPGVPFKVTVVVQNKGSEHTGLAATLRSTLLNDESLELRALELQAPGFSERQTPRFRVVRNDRVVQATFDTAPLTGGAATGVLTLVLECQLARSIDRPETLDVVFEAPNAVGGTCGVQILLAPPGAP